VKIVSNSEVVRDKGKVSEKHYRKSRQPPKQNMLSAWGASVAAEASVSDLIENAHTAIEQATNYFLWSLNGFSSSNFTMLSNNV
jgi:hypothetical protein